MAVREIAGALDIRGDYSGDEAGLEYVTGAAAAMHKRVKHAAPAAPPQGSSEATLGNRLPQPAVRVHRPDKGRRLPIGMGIFSSVVAGTDGPSVPSGGRLTIIKQPQVLYRFERITIPSDVAAFFMIEDILVGQKSVFAAIGSIPARIFDETATNTLLGVDTNQIATQLTTKIFNISALAQPFTGAFIGVAVE